MNVKRVRLLLLLAFPAVSPLSCSTEALQLSHIHRGSSFDLYVNLQDIFRAVYEAEPYR